MKHNDDLIQHYDDLILQMKPKVKEFIKKRKCEPIMMFDVLWAEWDCDSRAWIAKKKNGKHIIIMTSVGIPYVAKPSELKSRIKEYVRCTEETLEALEIVEKE